MVEHENSIYDAFELILIKRSTKTVLQTLHKILETCQMADPRTNDKELSLFQNFLISKFFRKIIEKIGKEMKHVLQNFEVIKQARSLVQFVKNRNSLIFNQTVLCIMYDGKKQKQSYMQELKRRTESHQPSDNWRDNPIVENTSSIESRLYRANAHRSPKMQRVVMEDADDGIFADEILEDDHFEKREQLSRIRRDGVCTMATPTCPERSIKIQTGGVGRAMIRRLTGIVTSSVKQVECEDNFDNTKFRSFHKRNKFSSVFGKSAHRDDEMVFRKGFCSQRRPATLGLPTMKNDLLELGPFRTDQVNLERFILNVASISNGVIILRTIMELSPPGTVPCNKMLSQIFRMDAPILCRAVVLQELIRYVRRCSLSWPRWMADLPLQPNRYDEAAYLKDFLYMKLTAGRCFYLWAESLSAELEELSRTDLETQREQIIQRMNISNYLQDEETSPTISVSRSLRMLGIVLLNDLTNHIKEHHHGAKSKIKKSFNHSDHHGTFLSLPKNRKNKNTSSQSSSPRMNTANLNPPDEPGFFDEGIMPHRVPFSRDSETNRSKGRLEFISQAVGVTAMRSIFGRWTNKDKEANEMNYMRAHDTFANPAHEEETRRKATSFRTQSLVKLEGASDVNNRFTRNLHWINNIGNYLCEDDFSCNHENGCLFFCHQHLKQSCSSLVVALKLVSINSNLKEFETSFLNVDPFESNRSIESDIFDDLNDKLYCAPLQMLVDNIQEIPDYCLRLAVNSCWNLLTSTSSKVSKNAAVVILLACQKFKDTIPQFLASKIEEDKIEHIRSFRVLWNTRNTIWHLVDRRVARLYKLPSLAVNISLPNPPIGECIPDVPDAPWIPYTPDVEILWAEEFNTQKNLIGDESQTRKKEQMKKVIENDQHHRYLARRQFYLTSVSVVNSVTQQYFKLNDHIDDYDETVRRFSSRLMSMSSSG